MPVVFFEGFNNTDSDLPKIDNKYWTVDNTKIYYDSALAKTDNAIYITNRSRSTGVAFNNTLTLSGFADPLLTNNCFGLGFYQPGGFFCESTGVPGITSPYNAKWLTFYRSGVAVLDLDIVQTTYESTPSLGIQVRQNNSGVSIYDFKSNENVRNDLTVGAVADTNVFFHWTNAYMYCEIFVDPKNQNRMAIRVSIDGGSSNNYLTNSSNSVYTSISGFSNLSSIRFYSNSDIGSTFGVTSTNKIIDNLYISGSGSADTTLLGPETYIYRINPDNTASPNNWTSNIANATTAVTTANGDTQYISTDLTVSGTTSMYSFTDLIATAPTGLILVKPINVSRKTNLDSNSKFINVMRTGLIGTITELGNSYIVSGNLYSVFSSIIQNNPVTGDVWKWSDINNMNIGVKTQGTG